jgi:hypothetical protein
MGDVKMVTLLGGAGVALPAPMIVAVAIVTLVGGAVGTPIARTEVSGPFAGDGTSAPSSATAAPSMTTPNGIRAYTPYGHRCLSRP